jgi:ornithine decarboxylase
MGFVTDYINDGVYGAFNCTMFDHQVVQPRLLRTTTAEESDGEPCSIWGPTCDSIDCVSKLSYLPPLAVGDWLRWENMGAYTVAAASQVCSRLHPFVCAFVDFSDVDGCVT